MKLFRLILALTLVNVMAVFFAPSLKAQSQEKSQIVTEYNGKQYYIHTVKKKQSLKDIAKIYDVAKENNIVIYTLHFNFLLPTLAVIVTFPFFFAVTFPFEFTVAIFLSLDDHFIF